MDIYGETSESLNTARFMLVVVAFLHLGFLVYYFGWLWPLIKFQNEWTGWATASSAVMPGPYIDMRWTTWQWYAVAIFVVNLAPPLVILFTVSQIYSRIRQDTTGLVLGVCVGLSLLGVAGLLIIWLITTNSTYHPFAISNSYLYCCAKYGSTAASGHCKNIQECIDYPSATVVLEVNDIFTQLLGSIIAFGILAVVELFILAMARAYALVALVNPTGSWSDPSRTKRQRALANLPRGLLASLYFMVVLVAVLFAIHALVGYLALDLRYSRESPATAPLGLQSARDPITMSTMVCSATVLLVPGILLLAVYVIGESGLIRMMVTGSLCCLTLTHLYAFFAMAVARGYANRPGQPNNPAISKLYCCAEDVRLDPASQCDNSIPCRADLKVKTSADLDYDPAHANIFTFTGVFVLLDLCAVAITICVLFWLHVSKRQRSVAPAASAAAAQTSQTQFVEGQARNVTSGATHRRKINARLPPGGRE